METAVEILQFVSVTAMALVAGAQVFCARAVLGALPSFPQEVSAKIHAEALTWRPDSYLKRLSPLAVVAAAAAVALILIDGDVDVAVVVLLVVASLLDMFQGIVTVRFEWPINDEVRSWGEGPVPDRYAEMRKEWDSKHMVRTVGSVLSFACFLAAALVY